MGKRLCLLFVLLFSGWFSGFAQQEETVVVDTVVTEVIDEEVEDEEDTVHFETIIRSAPVAVRQVPEKRLDSLKASEDFWYANAELKKPNKKEDDVSARNSLLSKQWFRTLLWIVILGSFIGVVIWYLVTSNILLFRKKAKKIGDDESADIAEENIFALQYDKEIAAAEKENNYRLAVRLWYLQMLKLLSDKGLIDYKYGRTNQDYVQQLFKSNHHKQFFRLTRNFEYTWYGQFSLSSAAYEMMRNDFIQFKTGLR